VYSNFADRIRRVTTTPRLPPYCTYLKYAKLSETPTSKTFIFQLQSLYRRLILLHVKAGTAVACLSHRNSVCLSVRHMGGSAKNGGSHRNIKHTSVISSTADSRVFQLESVRPLRTVDGSNAVTFSSTISSCSMPMPITTLQLITS